MKEQTEKGENYIKSSFMIYIYIYIKDIDQMILGCSN